MQRNLPQIKAWLQQLKPEEDVTLKIRLSRQSAATTTRTLDTSALEIGVDVPDISS